MSLNMGKSTWLYFWFVKIFASKAGAYPNGASKGVPTLALLSNFILAKERLSGLFCYIATDKEIDIDCKC